MPVKSNLVAFGCFALFTIIAAPAAAATTALDGSLDLEVFTKANRNIDADPRDSKSWFNFGSHPEGPKDLGHITFDPEAKTANGKIDVKGHGDAFAHWDSADKGSITADISRSITLQNAAPDMSLIISTNWEYSFSVDQASTFNFDATFNGDGKLKGLGNWSLELRSSPDGQHFDEFEDVTLDRLFDGTLQHSAFDLRVGRTYALFLFGGDQNHPDDGKTLIGGYKAQFDWSIVPNAVSPAPEPSSWLLMIAGFGLTGGMMRRRRTEIAQAAAAI